MEDKNLVRRPDGSYVDVNDLPPRQMLAHELVMSAFPQAEDLNEQLIALKLHMLTEMRAYRDVMLQDFDLDVTGKEGGFSIKSADGLRMVKLEFKKHVSFGPELLAAKELIDQFLNLELENTNSEVIRDIVTDAFKLNSKGRLNTDGILGLRKHNWDHPIWKRAMDAIDEAICRDSSTTYVRFYNIDPETKGERQVKLSFTQAVAA